MFIVLIAIMLVFLKNNNIIDNRKEISSTIQENVDQLNTPDDLIDSSKANTGDTENSTGYIEIINTNTVISPDVYEKLFVKEQMNQLETLDTDNSIFIGDKIHFIHPNANRKPSVKVNLREYDDENVQPFENDLAAPDRDWLDNYGKLSIITGEIQEWRNPLTGSIGRMIPQDEYTIEENEVTTVCRNVDMHYIKISGEELYSVGHACKKPGEEWSCDFNFKTVRNPIHENP